MTRKYDFITDRLAIGDISARAVKGWAAIVTVCTKDELIVCDYDLKFDIPVLHIEFDDGYSENYKQNLDRILEFIFENIKNGCVLVHCAAGISRSASIVVAYLCRYAGMSMDEALCFIRNKRRIISPAPYFIRIIGEHFNLGELYKGGPREVLV